MHAAALLPSQLPPQVIPEPLHGVRAPTGAPVTGEHVPILFGRLHAAHCDVHVESQHTPSMQ